MSKEYTHIDLGVEGERLAAEHLVKNGYEIIECNYRCKIGEIDIVARQKNVLCFVEVKTRTSPDQGHPLESITLLKQRKISLSALSYLQEHEILYLQDSRFDVVSILDDGGEVQIEIIPNAFDSCV
ncbi:MAG: YraN family protein [Candidatus Omnitrophota bacterium]